MCRNISKCLTCIYFVILFCGCFAESVTKTKTKTIEHARLNQQESVTKTKTKTIEHARLNQQAITVNGTCVTSSECAGKLLCYSGVCDCALGHFWSGADCLLKKTFRESCASDDECQETYICDGTCQCSETDYWDGHACSTKKPAFAECSSTIECRNTLYCSRHICQCFATDYWTGTSCSLRKSIDIPCISSLECKDTLQCVDYNCTCDESNFWNGTFCMGKKSVNIDCSSTTECKEELICLRNKCHCPITDYWDGSKCEKRKTFGQSCAESLDCKDPLQCSLGLCQCATSEFWSIDTCIPRRPVDSICTSSKECKENLECTVDNRCRCQQNYYWDGLRCSLKLPSECSDLDVNKDGIYSIYPAGGRKMSVYCIIRGEQKWTVLQRRFDGSIEFRRSWREFKSGFGSANGEYWLGNDNIHYISKHGSHELSIYIEDWNHNYAYANYSSFWIENEKNNYQLRCSGYNGYAGDSFCGQVNYKYFSTYDKDTQGNNCVQSYGGVGWWYYSCNYYAAVNGKYNGTSSEGFKWYHWTHSWNRPLRSSLLMIRRKH